MCMRACVYVWACVSGCVGSCRTLSQLGEYKNTITFLKIVLFQSSSEGSKIVDMGTVSKLVALYFYGKNLVIT